ncbi:MAG: type III-B CRISPR-associated protein Cas10/Cmr2, partial [Rubrobacter sp.]
LEAVREPDNLPNDPAYASVGSLPNRFSLLVDSEEDGRKFARAADESLESAWLKVSDASWRHLTARHDPLKNRAHVWDRQIGNLWEKSWVVSEDPRALAGRKLIRVFEPSEEPGRKCTVCGRREELGGRDFWRALSTKLGTGFLDLLKERLCAVCLVKRTLPRVGNEAFGWKVLISSFPSTPDLASDPWRRRVTAGDEYREARESLAAVAGNKPFDRLEGGYFYPSYHEELVEDESLRTGLGRKLSALYKVAGVPHPTYAILVMDGDKIGERLSRLNEEGRAELSERILAFSLRVQDAVENAGVASRLVYAGGEDVLALLPMDKALQAAWNVRGLYREVFGEFDQYHRARLDLPSTISAGLLYCPMTLPLRTATLEAHRLLDEDAKEAAGRDALAIGAWKGGGEVLRAARKWEHEDWVEKLLEMTGREGSPYPARFLYQAQELVREQAGLEGVGKLLALEYLGSREPKFKAQN